MEEGEGYDTLAGAAAGQLTINGDEVEGPCNTAKVLQSVEVCESVVHVVDAVLLPAEFCAGASEEDTSKEDGGEPSEDDAGDDEDDSGNDGGEESEDDAGDDEDDSGNDGDEESEDDAGDDEDDSGNDGGEESADDGGDDGDGEDAD